MQKVDEVIIFSGGMDSGMLLWWRLKLGKSVAVLSVNYGQRHDKELSYAESFLAHCEEHFDIQIPFQLADLRSITHLMGNSSQTDMKIAVPHGHYAAENMKLTVVPNRNMIMLSVAMGWAITLKAPKLLYGAHSGDHTIYPDCRPEFVQALAQAMKIADWHEVVLEAPFQNLSKADMCALGMALGVPYEMTWSCYQGGAEPCGKCGACNERRESFEFAGVPDPYFTYVPF